MALYEFLPVPMLREFVRVYRIVRFTFRHHKTISPKPYPPRPEQCLSFYPHDTERVEYSESRKTYSNIHAVLFGQQNEMSNRYVGKNFLIFQIVFRPGALFRMTGIPSNEITNAYLDAELVFKTSSIKETNERLAATDDFSKMLEIVEDFLIKEFRIAKQPFHPIDLVSNSILHSEDPLSIDLLAKESCLSVRQYQRRFVERMGVSPKYFQKVVQFENAFRMRNMFPHYDWLKIAVHCGYHDYQHLSKTYQSLTGQNPNEFHLLDLSAPERSFGEADTY